MALGDLIKAQKIVVRAKGWDPDKIEGFPGENMVNYDRAPDPWMIEGGALGPMPGGKIPAQQGPFPEDHGNITVNATPFNTPEHRVHGATKGANPIPGKPGA